MRTALHSTPAVERAGASRSWRTPTAAMLLFLLTYFVVSVVRANGTKVQFNARALEALLMATLIFVDLVANRRRLAPRVMFRVFAPLALLVVLACTYTLPKEPPEFGTMTGYATAAAFFAVTYGLACAFAVLFYEEAEFVELFWKIARVSLWVALAGWALSVALDAPILSNVQEWSGKPRLQGLLSEPSAWAPVIPALVLVAVQRRSYRYVFLAGIGAVLAGSPAVLIVSAVSLPLFYLVTSPWRARRVLMLGALVVLAPLAVNAVINANPRDYVGSSNSLENAFGRLLAGIRLERTEESNSANQRLVNAQVTLQEVHANRWSYTGYGPGSSSVYFAAKFPSIRGGPGVRPNALWIDSFFHFGWLGLLFLAPAMMAAVVALRRHKTAATVFIPFLVASMVNSAEGTQLYKFVAVVVVAYGFGWARGKRSHGDAATGGSPSFPAVERQPPGPMLVSAGAEAR